MSKSNSPPGSVMFGGRRGCTKSLCDARADASHSSSFCKNDCRVVMKYVVELLRHVEMHV